MSDSYLGGYGRSALAGLVAELVAEQMGYLGDDDYGMGDYDLGDLVSGEVGLRARRAMKKLKKKGYSITPKNQQPSSASSALAELAAQNPAAAAMVAAKAQQAAVQMTVAQTGLPATAGPFLAATGQRKEPVNLGTATIAITIGSTGVLSVTLQRALQTEKLVLQASDSTTGADMLFSLGLSNVTIGAHNLFATPGTVGAATSFARDSWETNIISVPLGQGGSIRVDLQKIAATTNTTIASGTVFGTGAQG